MLTLLSNMSGIWMRKVGLMPLSYLDRLRNSLPKIKGYQMNSHRIRNKIELWTEHWLVTKAVDIFIFKGIIKGVLCCCCGSPNDASSRKHIISIMILKTIRWVSRWDASHCWWDEAQLPEKEQNLFLKLQHFPDRGAYAVWCA